FCKLFCSRFTFPRRQSLHSAKDDKGDNRYTKRREQIPFTAYIPPDFIEKHTPHMTTHAVTSLDTAGVIPGSGLPRITAIISRRLNFLPYSSNPHRNTFTEIHIAINVVATNSPRLNAN